MCKALRTRLLSVRSTLTRRQAELSRYKAAATKMVAQNQEEVESSMGDHFKRINELVVECEKLMREKCNALKNAQKTAVSKYLVQAAMADV